MTAETARIGPAGDRSGDGDIVISIDAMSGDRGVAEVVRGMAMSLEKNPRLRYLVLRRRRPAGALDPQGQPARGAHRGAARRRA